MAARLGALVISVMLAGACAPVKPHQRARLASRAMVPPFSRAGLGDHDDKVVQTRTGGGLPGAAVGGGCGCTQ